MKKTLILLFVVFLFAACKNEKEQTSEMPETVSPIDHEKAVHPENIGDLDNIRLDQGKPWKVKPEISVSINSISETISKHSFQNAADYRELGAKLQEQRREYEKVRGTKAEENVNVEIYLNALDNKIERMAQVSSVQEGERVVAELEEQLQQFPTYFN